MGIPTVDNYTSMLRDYVEDVTLRRSVPAVFNSSTGRFTQPSSFKPDETLSAAVYRTSVKEAEILPEGVRNKQLLTLFTTKQLLGASSANGTDGDRIVYRGDVYEVFQTEDWFNTGSYFKSIAIRQSPAGGR